MNEKIKMFCLTHKKVNFLEDYKYNLVNIGEKEISSNYLNCNLGDNIISKERYYAELTFHYWYWKNQLDLKDNNWIGFCQRRRFWVKDSPKENEINKINIKDYLLTEIPEKKINFESFLTNPVSINKIKKTKMIKKGIRSLIKSPMIFFDITQQTLKFQFEIQHGYDLLEKAVDLLDQKNKYDFMKFMENSTSFNADNMLISKPKILNDWYNHMFPWLEKCEKKIGFQNFKNYETRFYAFLVERYISYWFRKYTNFNELPWIVFEE